MFEHELKNAYIGEYKAVECDFTTGDNGFTYGSQGGGNNESHGRTSNGFYVSSNYAAYATWKIPSSIYSKGQISKIEMGFTSTCVGCGGGLSNGGSDSYTLRIWSAVLTNKIGLSTTSAVSLGGNTPTTLLNLTIDLDNKIAYSDVYPSNILALSDTEITAIQNAWSNGSLYILAMRGGVSGTTGSLNYGYIKNAKFYF